LDEPTIGLHPKDNDRLIETMKQLRDLGNTLIVVEHDSNVIAAADHILDFGPKAGDQGGTIVAQGTIDDLTKNPNSLTGKYISKSKTIKIKSSYLNTKQAPSLSITGCHQHNLKHLDVTIPSNRLTVITGVSGSGKSSLMHDTLYPALKDKLGLQTKTTAKYAKLTGWDHLTQLKMIDQSPIGRTPRSNPATYTKVFDHIRTVMSQTKEAKLKGYAPGRFSFNVKGGRCEACRGDGQVKISMQFLADVYVNCDVCHGKRYNTETLGIKYKDHTIADILDLTVDQAAQLFKNHDQITKKLDTLKAVGLGYLKLGQPAPTLSGGEAQRVKLAKELTLSTSGHTLYLLDEPTTGLHYEDVKHLLTVLKKLVSVNNTVVVIEHNLDVIANADWIIDLGPLGGDKGGTIVATGTPDDITNHPTSITGNYLKAHLTK
jgi:excinuclease ABC subunit A